MNKTASLSFTALPLAEKIGQLFIIGIAGPYLDDAAMRLLDDVKPGGVCLFSRNIREAAQTRMLTDGLRRALGSEPIICIDQEGGLVDRLRRILEPMPAASEINSEESAAELGRLTAAALRLLGFNLDFAPVVDVARIDQAASSNGLSSRTFGSSAPDVVRLAGAFLTALHVGGIAGCLKHFPGLGASTVDSHEDLPRVMIDEHDLNDTDLVPFKNLLSSVEAVMVAHAAYPLCGLQGKDQSGRLLPASLNPSIVNRRLRDEMGFDGVAITDDLEMGAILKHFGIAEACVRAVKAGEDMLAICAAAERIREGHAAIVEAVKSGMISEQRIDVSLLRIQNLKARFASPIDFELDRVMLISNEIQQLRHRLN